MEEDNKMKKNNDKDIPILPNHLQSSFSEQGDYFRLEPENTRLNFPSQSLPPSQSKILLEEGSCFPELFVTLARRVLQGQSVHINR